MVVFVRSFYFGMTATAVTSEQDVTARASAQALMTNPNGIASHSPRLPYSATLGKLFATGPNPKEVEALAPRMLNRQA